jgi:hypothetical protein
MRFTSDRARRGVLMLAVLVMSAAGCERVVSVNAPSFEPRLVVEARLERPFNRRGPVQRIRLTTTQDVFTEADPPPARGAVVRVVDAAGVSVSFAESGTEPGVYIATAPMNLPVNQSLTLLITWNGDQYQSRETMQRAVPIDSLGFTEGGGRPGLGAGLRAAIWFIDPETVTNFYLWEQFVDGVRQVTPDSGAFTRAVRSDEISDGALIREFKPYSGVVVRPGQVVRVRQLSISAQTYRFYESLSEQTRNNGSPFGVPVSSIRGNVANVTRPGRLALGYFIASEYFDIERTVP